MLELSSTSALVLLWAQQECYQSEKAKDYLNSLDLKAGNALYEQCEKICPFYDEVIKNRKFGVFDLIRKCFTEEVDIQQIIIAGAGLDALGIEVMNYYPQIKVFELDIKDMDVKASLFSKFRVTSKSSISFIDVNLLNTLEVHSKLSNYGWNPVEPTLLILEGLSYYLPVKSIQKLIEVINPNRTVFEFLKRNKEIIAERARIAEEVFGLISTQCDCSYIVRYNYAEVENLFELPILAKYSMKQLEKRRTGTNRFFPTEKSGWIEVCLLGDGKANDLCITNRCTGSS